MASKATWNKWGLRLDIQTSKRPLPKTAQAHPLPDFGEALASLIAATYYTSSTVKGPYIVISESNGPAMGETWWIGHSTDGVSWEERPVSAGPLAMNWYRPEESRTHYFRVRVLKNGVSVNHPPVSVYVPVRPPAHFSGASLPPPGSPYRIGDTFTVDSTGVQWTLTLSGWVDVKGLADGAQSGVNTINDPDTLSLNEKPQIIQDYGAITGEHAKLLADGAAFAPTERAAYVAAYDALVVSYLPTLTSPVAWNSLSGTTALGTGNRVALWNPKWQAVRDTANALRSANTSGAYNLALTNAATDAQNKANLAQLRSQPHKVAWAYASKPALPDTVNYPAGYYAITTDNRTVQVNPDGTAWDDVLVAATGLFGKLFASMLTISNTNNLIPNANSEMDLEGIPSSAYEANGVSSGAVPGRSGSKYRYFASGGDGLYFNRVQASFGEPFYFEFWAWNLDVVGAIILPYLIFRKADGSLTDSGAIVGSSFNLGDGGEYKKCYVSGIAPAGAASVDFHANAEAGNGGFAIDDLFASTMTTAGLIVDGGVKARHLETDLALVNTIRSTNYVAGTSSAAPVGFKMAGQTFTTNYIGGATAPDCQFELGGSANFGGHKVATVIDRLNQLNRIVNGYFYGAMLPWNATGPYLPTWYSTTGLTGSAMQGVTLTTPATVTRDGAISQAFVCPSQIGNSTILLKLRTGIECNGAAGDSSSGVVAAHLVDLKTSTDYTLATWTYGTASGTRALSMDERSVDITSYMHNDRDYVIRLDMSATLTSSSMDTIRCRVHVDRVSIIA